MTTRILRINALILFLTLTAVSFTLCACSTDKDGSVAIQQADDALSSQQEEETVLASAQAERVEDTLPAREEDDIFDGDPETCSMCHVNVEIEILKAKTKHAAAGVDCITCHGRSIGHIQDEINEEKPDRVITEATTNSFCDGCHDSSASHDEEMISRMVCTNCHDAHATLIPGQ